MFIQTEATPNPATLKFLPGRAVMPEGTSGPDACGRRRIASRRPAVRDPRCTGVFFGPDFITVTKDDREWQHLKPAILGAIMEHFMSGAPPCRRRRPGKTDDERVLRRGRRGTVATIKELLDTRVRPAVADDGGDITFRGFKDGTVYLVMKGACSGCPSSTATLRTASRTCCATSCRKCSRSGRSQPPLRRQYAVDHSLLGHSGSESPEPITAEGPRLDVHGAHHSIASASGFRRRFAAPEIQAASSRTFPWRRSGSEQGAPDGDEPLRVLAIDTALGACSACMQDTVTGEMLARETIPMERGHAEALLPLIDRLVSPFEGGFESLDRVAVTVGPGSYTGLRVGISAARGIGLAAGVPVVGVATLSAFLAPLMASDSRGLFTSAIDAKHGHIYVQAIAYLGKVIIAPSLMSYRDAIRQLGSGPRRSSPARPRSAACGRSPGARCRGTCDRGLARARYRTGVARLGAIADPATALPKPLYLREPHAKPQDGGPNCPPVSETP